jgi:CRISPR-associated endonuclease Csn1
LYPGDLLHFKHKKGMKVTYSDKAQGLVSEDYIYFTGADITTASFAGDSNDKTFSLRGMGIQSLEVLEKCQVDVLGNITKVNKETRMTFR